MTGVDAVSGRPTRPPRDPSAASAARDPAPGRPPLRVRVDREACCGSGNCVLQAPEVFDQDDADGLVRLRAEHPPHRLRSQVSAAELLCPTGAIELLAD